jgi:hypothetical protein
MSTVFGVAFGDPAKTHITIEDINGLRIINGSTVKLQLDTSGAATFLAGHVTIADPNGIEIAAGATGIANQYGYTWGTGFSGSNQVGVYAYEVSSNARSLYLYNVTTQSASYADASLFASANGATSAVFSAVDDHRSTPDTYLEASVTMRPSADSAWDLGTVSKQWRHVCYAGHLYGAGGNNSIYNDFSTRIRFDVGGAGVVWDGSTFTPLDDNSRSCGVNGIAWNNVWSYGYPGSSDAALKRGVVPCSLGTDFLMALRPVDFYFKADATNRRRHGLIMQEVPATFGGRYDEVPGHGAIDYTQMVAPLVVGFQDHQHEIEALRARVAELERRLAG